MRFAVAVLACALAVANAQFRGFNNNNFGFGNGQYQAGKYQKYQNGAYNPYQQFNRNQNYNQYQPYRPFASTTFPPKVVVPAKVFASASVTQAPAPASVSVVSTASPVSLPVVPIAKVASSDALAETVKSGYDINPDGTYNYYYETNNGIVAQAQGTPRNFGGNPPVVPDVAQGSFSWISPEGKAITVTYVADENGYQPQSDAIPQPPEVPAQIARALAYAAKYNQN